MNTAVKQHITISPRLVEEAAQDPRALEKVSRAMAAVNLHNLFVAAQKEGTTVSTRLALQQLLNRMGRIDAREEAAGGMGTLPMVQISMGGGVTTVSVQQPSMPPAQIVDVEDAKELPPDELPDAPAQVVQPLPELGATPLKPEDVARLADDL